MFAHGSVPTLLAWTGVVDKALKVCGVRVGHPPDPSWNTDQGV